MFTWDGMYLVYKGDFGDAQMMMDVCPNAHPSWERLLGTVAFVARFNIVNLMEDLGEFLVKNEIFMKSTLETLCLKVWVTTDIKETNHEIYYCKSSY